MSDRLLDAAAIADRLGVPKSWVLESARCRRRSARAASSPSSS